MLDMEPRAKGTHPLEASNRRLLQPIDDGGACVEVVHDEALVRDGNDLE